MDQVSPVWTWFDHMNREIWQILLFFQFPNFIIKRSPNGQLGCTKIRYCLHSTFWMFQMIEFFWPNSRALLPTFSTNCPDGSHFAQMGSHFAQNTTTNPCSLLNRHQPLSGICTNTKHPQPRPKTPLFLAWFWKWAKWTTVWANWTASGQNVWKVSKTFLEVSNLKKIYSYVSRSSCELSESDTLSDIT